ncbi:hypothetical protein EMIT0232MI5_180131 [Pseudomonas sp. IT-232MI5]
MRIRPPTTIPAITRLITTVVITGHATTAVRVITTVATGIGVVTDGVITAADITVATINQRLNDSVFQMNRISLITCFNLLQERTRCRKRCLIFRQSPIK